MAVIVLSVTTVGEYMVGGGGAGWGLDGGGVPNSVFNKKMSCLFVIR